MDLNSLESYFRHWRHSILDIGGMGAFLKAENFVCLHPLNRCFFYPFLMKIFFSKYRALDQVQ